MNQSYKISFQVDKSRFSFSSLSWSFCAADLDVTKILINILRIAQLLNKRARGVIILLNDKEKCRKR